MNKKIIAVAIAAAMAAPVAMADVKLSGRVGIHFTSLDTDGATDKEVGYNDQGHNRIQIDAKLGNAFARQAFDTRKSKSLAQRENYLGYKFGGGMAVQFGRMAGAAKNIEKDPYIATFLQTRNTLAESVTSKEYGSSSFVNSLAQFSMKAGSAKIKIQYDAASNSKNANRGASSNEGHTAIAVTGKAGAVNYWASYNNGTADGNNDSLTTSQSNIKVGAAMKFGAAKVSLNYTSMDKDGLTTSAGNSTDTVLLMADMGLGKGLSVNAAIATRSGDVTADDADFIRLAVSKKLNKGVTAYAGFVSKDYDASSSSSDTDEVGVGMTVKF